MITPIKSITAAVNYQNSSRTSTGRTRGFIAMPRRCSVSGCKSNYDGQERHITTFSLPKAEPLRSQWLRKIPTDLSRIKNPCVCLKHFEEPSIIREDTVMVKGEIKVFPRIIPKLTPGALPTLFPNFSKVFEVSQGKSRSERFKKLMQRGQMPHEACILKSMGDRRHLRRHTQTLEKLNNEKFMENFNPETSARETRKVNRKVMNQMRYRGKLHDSQGIHITSGKDLCDCCEENCPGCHFPCPKCKSQKCGPVCRTNRKWVYEQNEIEGTDVIFKHPAK